MTLPARLALSPCPWPCHVKAEMSPLPPPNCLSWVSTALVIVALTLSVAPISISVYGWQARLRGRGKEEPHRRGRVALPLACSNFPAPSPHHAALHTHHGSGPHVCLSTRAVSWLAPLALPSPRLCGPGQKLPCILGDFFSCATSSSSDLVFL